MRACVRVNRYAIIPEGVKELPTAIGIGDRSKYLIVHAPSRRADAAPATLAGPRACFKILHALESARSGEVFRHENLY